MADKKNDTQKALERVAEAARLLAVHGAEGYSVDTGALDVVFLRALRALRDALGYDDFTENYDPMGDIYAQLSGM